MLVLLVEPVRQRHCPPLVADVCYQVNVHHPVIHRRLVQQLLILLLLVLVLLLLLLLKLELLVLVKLLLLLLGLGLVAVTVTVTVIARVGVGDRKHPLVGQGWVWKGFIPAALTQVLDFAHFPQLK